jgi:mRNA interferase MazF
MNGPGKIALFAFPKTDLVPAKLRPALILGKLPGAFDDWLICMISSQTRHCIEGFDDIISPQSPDFSTSGLKTESLIRTGRLAVVADDILLGSIGEISNQRLQRIKSNLASWLNKT